MNEYRQDPPEHEEHDYDSRVSCSVCDDVMCDLCGKWIDGQPVCRECHEEFVKALEGASNQPGASASTTRGV